MYPIHSGIENQVYDYKDLSYILFRLGFENEDIEFEKGSIDYPLNQPHGGRAFLRIPIYIEIGHFNEPEAKVRIAKPYILSQSFEEGLAEEGLSVNLSSTVTRTEADSVLHPALMEEAERVIEQVEKALLQ
ncbi:YugN family protein [Allobacillus halotolerans]|uniref:YugN-like family protein n=1 Tax=Allobacillus halotolerans TaxID=570278 RepID=A0ABS6GMN1_9BACI|nr:YugN family protein [Allobacillus halotolerans]MBU6080361.1 YugN-like family protein [Allobacillus halotolerans]